MQEAPRAPTPCPRFAFLKDPLLLAALALISCLLTLCALTVEWTSLFWVPSDLQTGGNGTVNLSAEGPVILEPKTVNLIV